MHVDEMNDDDILAEARKVLKEIEEEQYYYESGLFLKDFFESEAYKEYQHHSCHGSRPNWTREFEKEFHKKYDFVYEWLRKRSPDILTRNKYYPNRYKHETGWGDVQAVLEWIYPKIPLFERPSDE